MKNPIKKLTLVFFLWMIMIPDFKVNGQKQKQTSTFGRKKETRFDFRKSPEGFKFSRGLTNIGKLRKLAQISKLVPKANPIKQIKIIQKNEKPFVQISFDDSYKSNLSTSTKKNPLMWDDSFAKFLSQMAGNYPTNGDKAIKSVRNNNGNPWGIWAKDVFNDEKSMPKASNISERNKQSIKDIKPRKSSIRTQKGKVTFVSRFPAVEIRKSNKKSSKSPNLQTSKPKRSRNNSTPVSEVTKEMHENDARSIDNVIGHFHPKPTKKIIPKTSRNSRKHQFNKAARKLVTKSPNLNLRKSQLNKAVVKTVPKPPNKTGLNLKEQQLNKAVVKVLKGSPKMSRTPRPNKAIFRNLSIKNKNQMPNNRQKTAKNINSNKKSLKSMRRTLRMENKEKQILSKPNGIRETNEQKSISDEVKTREWNKWLNKWKWSSGQNSIGVNELDKVVFATNQRKKFAEARLRGPNSISEKSNHIISTRPVKSNLVNSKPLVNVNRNLPFQRSELNTMARVKTLNVEKSNINKDLPLLKFLKGNSVNMIKSNFDITADKIPHMFRQKTRQTLHTSKEVETSRHPKIQVKIQIPKSSVVPKIKDKLSTLEANKFSKRKVQGRVSTVKTLSTFDKFANLKKQQNNQFFKIKTRQNNMDINVKGHSSRGTLKTPYRFNSDNNGEDLSLDEILFFSLNGKSSGVLNQQSFNTNGKSSSSSNNVEQTKAKAVLDTTVNHRKVKPKINVTHKHTTSMFKPLNNRVKPVNRNQIRKPNIGIIRKDAATAFKPSNRHTKALNHDHRRKSNNKIIHRHTATIFKPLKDPKKPIKPKVFNKIPKPEPKNKDSFQFIIPEIKPKINHVSRPVTKLVKTKQPTNVNRTPGSINELFKINVDFDDRQSNDASPQKDFIAQTADTFRDTFIPLPPEQILTSETGDNDDEPLQNTNIDNILMLNSIQTQPPTDFAVAPIVPFIKPTSPPVVQHLRQPEAHPIDMKNLSGATKKTYTETNNKNNNAPKFGQINFLWNNDKPRPPSTDPRMQNPYGLTIYNEKLEPLTFNELVEIMVEEGIME